MKEILREFIIYQLLAVVMTLLAHGFGGFAANVAVYLVITNCISWSIRTMFWSLSLRHEFLSWRWFWKVLIGVPAVAVGVLVGILLAAVPLRLLFGQDILAGGLVTAIFKGALPGALIVTVLILGYYGLRERLESEALERERLRGLRARAELAALRSKLDPHFLFNTLNSMLGLLRSEPEKVEEMILGLSEIYRKVLQLPAGERIALREEFELARRYLGIEQVRLGERLRFEIDLPEALAERAVPPLLIQPLVENAVLHGLAPKPAGGRLRLAADAAEGRLRITVEDDGVGMGAEPVRPGSGIGLSSARERLRLLFGEASALAVETPDGGGTRVVLSLPLSGDREAT